MRRIHLVLLWFTSSKNGFSSYAPDWVKKDFEHFPRVQINQGKSIEMLSTFSIASRDADTRAGASPATIPARANFPPSASAMQFASLCIVIVEDRYR